MAKANITNSRKGSDNGNTAGIIGKKPEAVIFTGEKDVRKFRASPQKVTIVFRQNRRFDLHVGREVLTFMGHEAKEVPKELINHSDFKQVQKYFIVKGV